MKMYGIQRVRLIVQYEDKFEYVNIPPLNNFRLVLNGRRPGSAEIDLVLESENESEEEIRKDLAKQFVNLKLFVNLYSDNRITAEAHHQAITDYHGKEGFEKTIENSLDHLADKKLPDYLTKRTTQQHILLQTALEELKNNDLFNAFPKLINWLDDNDHKGSSRFCSIRDSCDHGTLDKTRAIKNVNEGFPGEFEFEDDTLKRDSDKNKEAMKKHLPEVLNHIKQVFQTKYVE